MEDFELELKQDFLSESDDLLADAENAFLRLTVGGANSELIDEIFRLAHNLKGTSKAVGFNQVSELTHIAENLILKIKEGERQVSNDIITVLLDFKDKVQEMIQGLKDDLEAKFDMGDIEERLEKMTSGEDGPVSEEVASEAESNESESNEIVEEVPSFDSFENEPVEPVFAETEVIEEETSLVNEAALESMKELGISVEEIGEPKKEEAPVAELKKPESPAPTKPQADAKKANAGGASEESIRVKLSRIDELNNVVGELVILQTALYQRRYEHIQDDLSNKAIGMMGKLFKEVQELSMSLRMLPLKGTFQKMTRIVRDTSKALGKEVKLHMVGEETEVDKTVLEKLADPLVHIVRNSVDHGLESNEQREETGKARVGNVELLAYHEGSNLVIQVTDDGKGIDPEVIKTKAIVKGIIDEYSQMSDQEIIQLIFHPGFSTKEQVTEVSGRGVGMDVVRTNIEALGGEVKLMSRLGEGTSLKIILPLTLAIIDGLVIRSQEEKFVIPLGQVFEIVQVDNQEIEEFSGGARLFKLRGDVLPLFYLNNKLGANLEDTSRNTVIVVKGLSHVFGVVVDDIVIQQQIVIKKLGEDIKNRKGVMGSSIMGDGRPSLILDLLELFKNDLKKSSGYKKFLKEQNIAS